MSVNVLNLQFLCSPRCQTELLQIWPPGGTLHIFQILQFLGSVQMLRLALQIQFKV